LVCGAHDIVLYFRFMFMSICFVRLIFYFFWVDCCFWCVYFII